MARKGGTDRGLLERPKKGSGIWWCRYVGPDGREHFERGGNKSAARSLQARRKTEIADGTWQPPFGHGANEVNGSRRPMHRGVPTLGEYAETWLEERKPHLTKQVAYNYRVLLRTHLMQHPIARRRLTEIGESDIAALVTHLTTLPATDERKPLSPGRVNAVLKRVRSIFAVARRRKLIIEDPMEFVEPLREAKPDVDPFDLNESLRIIDAAGGWERVFLTVLLFTGMRPGEALALRWEEDIDFEHNLIRVRRTVSRRFGFGLPKTPGSERDVEMNATVKAALTEQRARSQLKGDLVFPSQNGTPIDLQNFRLRNWTRILKSAKVRPRVLYQCRHTFVRLAMENGDHPQHIASMLGHVSTEMIFKRYGRWMRRPQSQALAQLDAAIRARRSRKRRTGERPEQPETRPPKPKTGHDSGHDSRLKLARIK